MRIFIKFDFNNTCKKILEEKLNECQIKHRILGFGEVEFLEKVSDEKMDLFSKSLDRYGIEIVENQKTILIQKIKDAIVDMVFNEDTSDAESVFLGPDSYRYVDFVLGRLDYRWLDPDVYGEELLTPAYDGVDRIALVGAVETRP